MYRQNRVRVQRSSVINHENQKYKNGTRMDESEKVLVDMKRDFYLSSDEAWFDRQRIVAVKKKRPFVRTIVKRLTIEDDSLQRTCCVHKDYIYRNHVITSENLERYLILIFECD